MGCQSSKSNTRLPERIREKLIKIFESIDKDDSKSITREEAKEFFSKFGKVNSKAMFDTIDYDKSGTITYDEWMGYWEMVKKSGHTNQEIEVEVENLEKGETWVKFGKVAKLQKNEEEINKELEKEKNILHLKDNQAAKRVSIQKLSNQDLTATQKKNEG